MFKSLTGFHSQNDSVFKFYYSYPIDTPKVISHLHSSVTYQFFPHFHPYVSELVKRLNAESVAGLQAADTDYWENSDGSLTPISNSTRATVLVQTQVIRLSDNTAITLLAGAPLSLNDGIFVTIAKNTAVSLLDGAPSTIIVDAQVKLPGAITASLSGGTQILINGSPFILPDATPVSIAQPTQALLSDGTLVSLPAATQIGLRSGIPLPKLYEPIFSESQYAPSDIVQQPYPVKDLDFTISGAYSIYNWELFFHVPLLIAINLSKNQKFKDAQKWFHYIFDPTDDSDGPTPQRFWKVKPFQTTDVELIEKTLYNLSTGANQQLQDDTMLSIDAWKKYPFQPFVIADHRPTAFMYKTIMAYLDNLIDWGDSLFQQYTGETINEATQIFVIAANILGPAPQAVPKKDSVGPHTYAELRASLDPSGNVLEEIEVDIPFEIAPYPSQASSNTGSVTFSNIGQSLYFCIPRNEKLLAYWDIVADRLFKIHNSLNIQGVFQALPLFEPPIDPALLVRAAAAGLNVSAIVSGLDQPLPLVRFQLLVAKAAEISNEVISLGGSLLSAIEKNDNEALALVRAKHERYILALAEMIKYSQWQEAIKSREGLQQSLANAAQRYIYYQKQLGMQDNQISIPMLDDLDKSGLEKFGFTSNEPPMNLQPINVDISQDSPSVSDGEIKTMSSHETKEIKFLENGRDAQVGASGLEAIGAGLAIIPQYELNFEFMGVGYTLDFGGKQLHDGFSSLASVSRIFGEIWSFDANKTAKLGSYARRQLEWVYQSNLVAGEISQVFKQLRGAQIREAITQKEYDNHRVQIQQAQEIEDFLKNKETNQGFYVWTKREVKGLYNRCFQLAFEVAKKAERALQNELGDSSQTFIQFNYLDGMEGLLAGEKLLFDIKRMEMAYHDLNQREYELTKNVSLLQVAPRALVQLRATGSCTFSMSEEIFDLDGPGHFFRRLKSVAASIPCITGPNTSVNCTLTLLSSSIRTSSQLSSNGYARNGPDDTRFSDYYGSIQAVVTSSGQMDSGLFETNLHDERYLPFELSGAISEWRIDLPADVRKFDFNTITDIILHVRYTAREGGDLLKSGAVKNLQTLINNAQTVGSIRLFSIRHEFPTEWARFKSATIDNTSTLIAGLSLSLLPQHYPFWAQSIIENKQAKVTAVDLFAEMAPADKNVTINLYDKSDKTGKTDSLNKDPSLGNLLSGKLDNIKPPAAITDTANPPLTLLRRQFHGRPLDCHKMGQGLNMTGRHLEAFS